MTTVFINKFNEGVKSDPRDTHGAKVITNFDALSNPRKLTPYRTSESGDNGALTTLKYNFCVALKSGTTYELYSLGSSSSKPTITYKDLSTTTANDLDDAVWAATANNQSGATTFSNNLFVYYQKQGYIFGAEAGSTIFSYDPSGVAAWNSVSRAISYTNIGQGIVHSKDDILYIPYDNKIASNNNGSWTNVALTLPASMFVTSICEYNNYLAIACAPQSGVGNSVVYLWDRDATVNTLSESIDWGEGTLVILQQVDGVLIGISQLGGLNSSFPVPNSAIRVAPRMIISAYTGGTTQKLIEMKDEGLALRIPSNKQLWGKYLIFQMSIKIGGVVREGQWLLGRSSPNVPFALFHDRTPNNDTALGTGSLQGFYRVGDYVFQSYLDNSAAYGLSKSLATATFTATSIFESLINQGMPEVDKQQLKQLESVGATYENLPSGAQVVVKYKVDGAASWTTIFTQTSTGVVYTEPFGRASTANFTKGKEFEFRIESTGNAEITGLSYKYKVIPTNV